MSSEDTSLSDQTAATTEPSNGGLAAWSKVLGCFIVYINTWGISTSFGVYQSYYQQHLRSYSASTISWIGTLQVFLFMFVSIIAGPLFDRGCTRFLFWTGSFLVVFGLFMLSLAHSLWQIILSQSICIGIGSGLLFVPAVVIVSNAFDSKRPIALGIAATGSAVGGTIFPIMFRELIPAIGFAWTNRVFGFIELATSILAAVCLVPLFRKHERVSQSTTNRVMLDIKAFQEPPYAFLCAGLFFVELGFWIPPFTITPYAQLALGTSADYAFYLLAIMNGGSTAGRILPAFAAQVQRIGPGWVLAVGSLCLGALILAWLGIHSVAGITAWSVFVGFMSGIAVSVPNAVLPKLSPPATQGARSGMLWAIVSFAALIGTPIAGLLVDTKTGNYRNGQLFSGLSICLGSAMLCVPAVHISRKRRD